MQLCEPLEPAQRRQIAAATPYTHEMGSLRLALFTIMAFGCAAAAAETRLALVIGNSEYASGPLPNPANDAKMMADTLGNLGFEVIARRNADQNTMKRAIQEFGSRLEKGGPSAVGLFYYAGHGVQLNGRNYLIPTTAQIDREGDVEIEAVSADWVIEQMRYARNRLNIVILDACRNNPFTRSMRSVDHGLATMDAPAGILIAYSTAPGAVAMDGNGRDSPYTEALSQAMRDLHEPIEQVFKHVRVGVMGATANRQVPWESSSLTGDFYFSGQNQSAPIAAPRVAAAPSPARATSAATEPAKPSSDGVLTRISNWFGAGKSPEPAANPTADSFSARPPANPTSAPPAGAGAGAGANIVVATAPIGSVSGARALPMLKLLGIEGADLDASQNYPQAMMRQLLEHNTRHVTLGNNQKQIQAAFSMCKQYPNSECELDMFSDESLRTAALDPFDVDPLPVSVQAFRQFVNATRYTTEAETVGFANAYGDRKSVTGGNWRNGTKTHDVVDESAVVAVSFNDAVAYCRFKNQRLPTEDEWEYIARGPERHTFPWGENMGPAVGTANAAPRVAEGPAEGIGGRFRGLSGNVWQWVDTRATTPQGVRTLLKGASWLEPNPAFRRAAARRYDIPNRADEDTGFRCAKSVTAWPDAEALLARLR
jgi:formylglycine-generating enzyme required for sulfatase activity